MTAIAWLLIGAPFVLAAYAYILYPALLWTLSAVRKRAHPQAGSDDDRGLPLVSVSLPVYNEASQIRAVITSLLQLDYPREKVQIVVVSDASSDGTDDIVREFADQGVELLRLPARLGKTAAENAAAPHLRGEIVVNTDASIRILPDALRPLIASFHDPSVGVASGRDISVGSADTAAGNPSEAGYVGYEMWVRHLETRVGSIIGASGCFYAIRKDLHQKPLPAHLSRDFGAALHAREFGYRATSVAKAVCLVPRTTSLHREYNRKVRTISRGMETLLYKRKLLNPFRYGAFSWMLFSHKVCRWLLPVAAIPAIIGLALFVPSSVAARWLLAAAVAALAFSWIAWRRPSMSLPRPLQLLVALIVVHAATLHGLIKAIKGDQNAAWEPTRRETQLS